MSWIIGVIGNNITDEIKKTILQQRQTLLKTVKIPGKVHIVAGGNAETVHAIYNDNTSAIVAGIGLRRSDHSTHILASEEWASLIGQEQPKFTDLNGHFVVIRYKNNILECFSDRIGLRTLYLARTQYGWIFSTKLSWVCRHISQASIDWKIFGSKWLCLQQFTHESPIRHVNKLPPNGYARINHDTITLESAQWLSVAPNTTTKELTVDGLRSLITVEARSVKLGMSGGLDSRVLFSLLLSGKNNFSTYAFGEENNPDVASARTISEHKNIPFTGISKKFPSSDECIALMHDYVLQSNLVEGAASSVRLGHYADIHNSHSVMIDGGNGEIARRQFLQRMLVKAKNDILHLNVDRLYNNTRLHRADIFNDDLVSLMKEHAVRSLDHSFRSLPSPREIGVENFLDAWVVSTRIPIVACDEQARIDEHVLNFMPYSQPDYIVSVLNLPLKYRRNNRLYKQIIREHAPSLSRFNLVKNNISYPYVLSTIQSRLWTKAKSILGLQYQDPTMILFLDTVKEYICDTAYSSSTKNYSPYNFRKILHAVNSYYNGQKRFAGEVNWWIAFDVWRREVEK